MGTYSVSTIEQTEINLKPETELEEILQNVWVILNTLEYECPLARGLGLNTSYLDKTVESAQALCISDVFEKIETYEPRAEVMEVTFQYDLETGKVYAVVEVARKDEEEYTD